MKLLLFRYENKLSYGVMEGDKVQTLSEDALTKGEYQPAGNPLAQDEIEFNAPIDPPNVCAIGLNYRQHAEESNNQLPERPLLFLKATSAVTAHNTPIVLPSIAPDEVDYEGELAVVIGKTARNVTQEQASDYILGYTCANDVSARDCQLRYDGQWARGKSFDTFCPLGPWLETDLDPSDLAIQTRVNGKTMQDSRTSDMIFDCFYIVSFLSHCMTLYPGTVILTGTPSGVGGARKPPVFLQEGDQVEVEIEGVGTLKNHVRSSCSAATS